MQTASRHPYLAFQPKNVQSAMQTALKADERYLVLALHPELQQRAAVPDLFSTDRKSPGEALCLPVGAPAHASVDMLGHMHGEPLDC